MEGRRGEGEGGGKEVVFLQQALDTKVSRVSAAVASGGRELVPFRNGSGEEWKLSGSSVRHCGCWGCWSWPRLTHAVDVGTARSLLALKYFSVD